MSLNTYRHSSRQKYKPFIFTIDTTVAGTTGVGKFTISFFKSGVDYRCRVDWGDGNESIITSYNDPDRAHTYSVAGTYTVKIYGKVPRIYCQGAGDLAKIKTIEQWGNQKWSTMNLAFSGCTALTAINATDGPDLSVCTDLTSMFNNCQTLATGDFSSWDVSNVSYFNNMFSNCYVFNPAVESWTFSTTKNVTMSNMFNNARVFNRDLGSWNMQKVSVIDYMFQDAWAFNNGGTSNIQNWNLSALLYLQGVFKNATSFNQPLAGWGTTLSEAGKNSLIQTFMGATSFNQNISAWNINDGSITTDMFNGATAYNNGGSALTWTIYLVDTADRMFKNASAFNQPVSFAPVILYSAIEMFNGATAFNRTFSFLFPSFADATDFMASKAPGTYSSTNVDDLYQRHFNLELTDIIISFGTANYTAAGASARTSLINTDNWTITDGGQA